MKLVTCATPQNKVSCNASSYISTIIYFILIQLTPLAWYSISGRRLERWTRMTSFDVP